jgi:hypothetical protein
MTQDPRIRQYVIPTRIVWQTTGAAAPENPEALLGNGKGTCVLRNTGEAPGILLDFGRELHGGILLENGITKKHGPTRVRVRFGESVSEAMGQPNQDHSIHDFTCDVPWYGAQEFGNTGFRFVRIDLVEPDSELQLKRAQGVFLYRPDEYKGSFRCNDERLNRIWETGAYTVHLCMQERLWDGIKRDRLVWIGDMHPETMTICSVFGAHPIVPKSLDFVRDETPLPDWMNGIGSYSLWWVLIHHAWYLYHGDEKYLGEQRAYLLGLLKQLREQIDENGSEKMGGARFLDWPSSEDPKAIHAGLQALLAMGLRAGADLCHALGETDAQNAALAAANDLQRHIPDAGTSKQANALLALAALADAKKTNTDVLAADPLHGVSTFYGYYVLQARALAGDYAGALDVIRNYWGVMLDFGATTFWEDFNLAWTENAGRIDELVPEGKKDLHGDYGDYCYKGLRHSLCHGWASGPTAWLTEHVLGIKPLEPGCRVLRIAPHLAGLEFAEGTFPTPAGIVRVRHEQTATGIQTKVDAPEGIRIIQ